METETEEICNFLKDLRGMKQQQLEKIAENKIDFNVVLMMDLEHLTPFVPAYGDRVALMQFCKRSQGKKNKSTLFTKLKRNFKQKKITSSESDSETENRSKNNAKHAHLLGNTNAAKKKKRIDIGWQHFDETINQYKQVKEKTGGGIRKLEVNKDTKAEELMQNAIDIFFIDGQSSYGSTLELDFALRDFKQSKVDLTSTVSELYETSHLKLLRLYLFTKRKMQEDLPPLLKPRSNQSLRNTKEDLPTPLKTKQTVNVNKAVNLESTGIDEVMPLQTAPTSTFSQNVTLPRQSKCISISVDDQANISPPMLPGLHFKDSVISSCQRSSTQSIGDCSLMDFSDLIVFGPSDTINSDMLSETLELKSENDDPPRTPSPPVLDLDPESVHLRIHRVNVLDELISHFKNANIVNLKFKFEFVNECGSDVSGVSWDVYSSFWNIFLLKSAEGEEARVPCLASKWQNEEWKAIGRILLKGYTDCGYFPLQFAPAYVIALIFGEMSVTPEILLSSFMSYLSCSDRETVTAAINDALPEENLDDLTDILDQFGHNNIPPQDQMKYTLNLIAHKELIQKPKYALSGMAEAVRETFKMLLPNTEAILAMYEARYPTTKRVLKLLQAEPETNCERQCFRYFQQYVKSLQDSPNLKKLLQYLTGSNVICVERITVIFTNSEGILRCPVAHTCGPTLELPMTYTSYPDLRGEFESILSTDMCMQMLLA